MMLKGLVWKLQPPGYGLLVWSLSESVPEYITVLSLFSLTRFYFTMQANTSELFVKHLLTR